VPETLIAIVEDDSSMRRAMQRIVRGMGFQHEAYENAERLLLEGSPRRFGCFIVDIHLGGMTGLELVRHLAADGPGLPVIFVTALEACSYRQEAEQIGCVAYLRKPFEAVSLVEAIRLALAPADPQHPPTKT
jgi:FixJ family two-component response regulator